MPVEPSGPTATLRTRDGFTAQVRRAGERLVVLDGSDAPEERLTALREQLSRPVVVVRGGPTDRPDVLEDRWVEVPAVDAMREALDSLDGWFVEWPRQAAS